MIHTLTATTHQGAYRPLLNKVLNEGELITVRDRPTREILNNVLEIISPTVRTICIPGRRWNPWLAMSEGLWLLAGREDIEALKPYNARIVEFSDDGLVNYGAYGQRLFANGLRRAITLLLDDPSTRRAVIPIYEGRDVGAKSKDIPCNTQVMFKTRSGRLHMVVTNRSNDIHWGLFAVNLCQFSMLQETMAYIIGARVGTQVHFSQSLHVYLDEHGTKITDNMLEHWDEVPSTPVCSNMYDGNVPYYGIGMIQSICDDALNGNQSKQIEKFPFFQFAMDFLAVYRENKHRYNRLLALQKLHDGYKNYADWIKAGELFLADN